jgi:hypothetical protein
LEANDAVVGEEGVDMIKDFDKTVGDAARKGEATRVEITGDNGRELERTGR